MAAKHSRPQSPSFLSQVNEGLWRHPLVDIRKFRTSGHACAEVINITAHAHYGFLSLTAPLGKKFYFLSSLQRMASLGCFENTDFTQLEFIDNLESKGEDINKNQLNALLGFRSADYRLSVICEFTFGENKYWELKQDRGDQFSSFCLTIQTET